MVKNLPATQETRVRSLGQKDPLRKKWLSIPVFLPAEFHGQRSLVGYSPRGHKESDMTEQLTYTQVAQVRPLVRDRAKVLTELGPYFYSSIRDSVFSGWGQRHERAWQSREGHPKVKHHKYQLLSEAHRILHSWWEQLGSQVERPSPLVKCGPWVKYYTDI